MDPAVCIEMALKIEALYNWVGERKHNCEKVGCLMSASYSKGYNKGGLRAYDRTQDQMQTLFAGLIEFETNKEKQENGL